MAERGAVEDLREDALIDFLAKKGGRVKNKELVEKFKKFINAPEPQLKAKYRDIFKDIINKIALVKQEDGEKYIVLKKKYQHLVKERDGCHKEENVTVSTVVGELVEQFPKEERSPHSEDKQQRSNSDDPKNKKTSPMETLLKIHTSEPLNSKISAGSSTDEKVNMCEWIIQELPIPTADTKSKVPSELTKETQLQDKPSICFIEAFEEKQGKKLDVASESVTECPVQIEVKVEESQMDEFDSVFKNDSEQNGFEDGTGSVGSPSVALDPLEKEWLKCAASGQLTALCDLLRQDPSLAAKKDFTSFTALHWAAKHGKENMARMLINAGVDINLRAGYTPLHIAALHSHVDIMDLLIRNYGAKTNVRDYSGRFASHYLKDNDDSADSANVSSQLQQSRGERRNRKLAGLFLPKSYGSSRKHWGSVENLTMEDKDGSIFLSVPTSYKAVRKFSR